MSVSEEVYEFWKLVEALQRSTGSLFQPNAVTVRGNVFSVDNPEEEVLGVFAVSAVTRKILELSPADVPIEIPPLQILAYDCRHSLINGTTEKPPFW